MLYSLLVVQPRARRFFADPERYERFAVTLAARARRPVLAVCAALAVSGAGLVATDTLGREERSAVWEALVVGKAALLAAAAGLFAYVSWRLWPARLFALPDELPAFQRRLRAVAIPPTGVVGAGLALGAIADAVR